LNESIERLKQNPREDFIHAISSKDLARCLLKTAEIHGHFCPGSALGVMASVYGLHQLGRGIVVKERRKQPVSTMNQA
jgi:formylmethanofuran dehydrogenase subunit E